MEVEVLIAFVLGIVVGGYLSHLARSWEASKDLASAD